MHSSLPTSKKVAVSLISNCSLVKVLIIRVQPEAGKRIPYLTYAKLFLQKDRRFALVPNASLSAKFPTKRVLCEIIKIVN